MKGLQCFQGPRTGVCLCVHVCVVCALGGGDTDCVVKRKSHRWGASEMGDHISKDAAKGAVIWSACRKFGIPSRWGSETERAAKPWALELCALKSTSCFHSPSRRTWTQPVAWRGRQVWVSVIEEANDSVDCMWHVCVWVTQLLMWVKGMVHPEMKIRKNHLLILMFSQNLYHLLPLRNTLKHNNMFFVHTMKVSVVQNHTGRTFLMLVTKLFWWPMTWPLNRKINK